MLDANITTLIAAVVLFCLGSGPIRGFAVTLAIGIVTTVFTAYTLTRLLIAWWVQLTRPEKSRLRGEHAAVPLRFIPDDTHIVFMRSPHGLFGVDWCCASCRSACFSWTGLNYGIDFKGGTLIEIQPQGGPGRSRRYRAAVIGDLNLGDIQVQEFGGDRRCADPHRRTQGGGEKPSRRCRPRCAAAWTAGVRVPTRRSRRTDGFRRTGADGHHRRIVGPAGDPGLYLVPLRMAVRRRRDRRARCTTCC